MLLLVSATSSPLTAIFATPVAVVKLGRNKRITNETARTSRIVTKSFVLRPKGHTPCWECVIYRGIENFLIFF